MIERVIVPRECMLTSLCFTVEIIVDLDLLLLHTNPNRVVQTAWKTLGSTTLLSSLSYKWLFN